MKKFKKTWIPLILIKIFLTIIGISLLSSCITSFPGMQKVVIDQGNQLKARNLQQVRIGMSKEEIAYLLGTPVLMHLFHSNRWDYVHTLQIGNGPRSIQRVSLFFSNGHLIKITTVKDSDVHTTH